MEAIDIWRLHVPTHAASYAQYHALLDAHELARACAFRAEADRVRFVVAHGSLRVLLGGRWGCSPRALPLERAVLGKPYLCGRAAPQFNSSHSGDWVVHAIGAQAAVGVDVQAFVEDAAVAQTYARVLAPIEQKWLLSLPVAEQGEAFTTLWVAKEAYAKAFGQGLSRDFAQIVVDASGAGGQQVHTTTAETDPPCVLTPFLVAPRYKACLASVGSRPRVRVFDDAQWTAPAPEAS